jgi:CDP-diacylglycerol--inositol 3-phosphatidyltransferase
MRGRRYSSAMEENIFLFIPNIIGYARVVLALVSFYFMPTHLWLAGSTYLLSGFLDAFDGWAARKFSQGTMFGAVLDMVTDRVATTCLIVVLGHFYPAYLFLFQFLIALDISSHWIQMYSSLQQGDSSHKVTDLSANPVMRFYYMRPVLFAFCAANELFFCSLYVLYFTPGFSIPLFGAEVGIWTLLALVCSPISFLKQCVSIVQLVVACQNLGGMDAAKRARKPTDNR